MVQYTVDIQTRILPETHRAYILFPGDGYRYYEDMKNTNSVFLDLPGFPLPKDVGIAEAADLVERITISDRIRDWHRISGDPATKPSYDVADLTDYRRTRAKQQLAGLIRGFFKIAPGSIIIVPPSSYDEDVLIGEIQSHSPVNVVLDRYPGESFPARRVRWIKRIRRDAIPGWLERKIPSPNPLRQFEANFLPYIYDMTYERYFYNGTFACKFRVNSAEFSTVDSFLFQQITLYVAALFADRQDGDAGSVANLPISVVASRIRFSDDIPDQRISINSPGFIVLYSKNLIPILVGALMTIAVTAGAAGVTGTPVVNIVNSADQGSVSEQCVLDIQEEVMGDMQMMGVGRFRELCEIAAQAERRTQINPGMPVREEASGATRDRN